MHVSVNIFLKSQRETYLILYQWCSLMLLYLIIFNGYIIPYGMDLLKKLFIHASALLKD